MDRLAFEVGGSFPTSRVHVVHSGLRLMSVPPVHPFVEPNLLLLDLSLSQVLSPGVAPASLSQHLLGEVVSSALPLSPVALLSKPPSPQPALLYHLCVLVSMEKKYVGDSGIPFPHCLLSGAAFLKCELDLSRPSKVAFHCCLTQGKFLALVHSTTLTQCL